MRILLLITGLRAPRCGGCGAVFIAVNWVPDRSLAELKPRWGGPPSIFLDIEGMPVHVRDEGPRDDASPIVLLHGFGSSLHAWQGWAEALRDQRRVVRLDLPGFGLTGRRPTAPTVSSATCASRSRCSTGSASNASCSAATRSAARWRGARASPIPPGGES
jgi:hypothetical protein